MAETAEVLKVADDYRDARLESGESVAGAKNQEMEKILGKKSKGFFTRRSDCLLKKENLILQNNCAGDDRLVFRSRIVDKKF